MDHIIKTKIITYLEHLEEREGLQKMLEDNREKEILQKIVSMIQEERDELAELIKEGMLTEKQAEFIKREVELGSSIVIFGGEKSGKNRLLRALLQSIENRNIAIYQTSLDIRAEKLKANNVVLKIRNNIELQDIFKQKKNQITVLNDVQTSNYIHALATHLLYESQVLASVTVSDPGLNWLIYHYMGDRLITIDICVRGGIKKAVIYRNEGFYPWKIEDRVIIE